MKNLSLLISIQHIFDYYYDYYHYCYYYHDFYARNYNSHHQHHTTQKPPKNKGSWFETRDQHYVFMYKVFKDIYSTTIVQVYLRCIS